MATKDGGSDNWWNHVLMRRAELAYRAAKHQAENNDMPHLEPDTPPPVVAENKNNSIQDQT
jgi:hypothetical protein